MGLRVLFPVGFFSINFISWNLVPNMSTKTLKFRSAAIVMTLLALLVSGCGSGSHPRAKVKGRVKFFDKYLTAGTVAFTTKDGKYTGSANIDADGNYEMTDAPIGEVTITVKVPVIPKMGKGDAPKNLPPKGLPAMTPSGAAASDSTSFTPTNFDASKIVQIPGKYGSVDTSGLTYTVEKGQNQKDITLSP